VSPLQLAAALATPTGTGLLYASYDQGSDVAIWKNGAGASRSIVSLTRVQPKPTPTFPGVERFELKRTAYFTVADVEYVTVVTLGASIPVPIGSSDRTSVHLNAALLARDDIFKNAIETGAIPT
jgi:hypothetical protein